MSVDTISALATGIGTLILAIATFFATSSANRAARTAELAIQIEQRPLLMTSKLTDDQQKIMFADDHWAHVDGGGASFEYVNGTVYFVISLRNVGPGVAVLQGWLPHPERRNAAYPRADASEFRAHTRDLYVPPGDIGIPAESGGWVASVVRHWRLDGTNPR